MRKAIEEGDFALAGITKNRQDEVFKALKKAEVTLVCHKIYTDMIKPENMIDGSIMKSYPKNDFHKVYVCEIEKAFVKE